MTLRLANKIILKANEANRMHIETIKHVPVTSKKTTLMSAKVS